MTHFKTLLYRLTQFREIFLHWLTFIPRKTDKYPNWPTLIMHKYHLIQPTTKNLYHWQVIIQTALAQAPHGSKNYVQHSHTACSGGLNDPRFQEVDLDVLSAHVHWRSPFLIRRVRGLPLPLFKIGGKQLSVACSSRVVMLIGRTFFS